MKTFFTKNTIRQGKIFPVRMRTEKSASEKEVEGILDFVQVGRFVVPKAGRMGAPRCSRVALAKAFVVKAVLGIAEDKALREVLIGNEVLAELCGFGGKVPSRSTFSRAFAEFATYGLTERVHEALVRGIYEGVLIGHISRDSTAVPVPEKAGRKVRIAAPKIAKRRGRPPKGTVRTPKEETRLQRQMKQTLDEMRSELPTRCDWGGKRDSHGNFHRWKGYKLHIDWSDEGIPLSFLVTSASMSDSGAAIPLTRMTSLRIDSALYELMDAAYDAAEIKAAVRREGRIPLIEPNPRRSLLPIPMEPAERIRYRERSTSERGFSVTKRAVPVHAIAVKGNAKVATAVGFMLIVIAVRQAIRYKVRFDHSRASRSRCA